MTRITVPLLLLALLLATPALANPNSRIIITTDRPVVVVLDGAYLEYTDGTTNVEKWNIAPGRHLLEIKNMVGKTLHESDITVPGGGPVEVRARWKDKEFELIDTVFVEVAPAPTEVIVVERQAPVRDGVSVSIGVPGAGVTITGSSSGTTTHETVNVYGHHGGGEVVVVTEETHYDDHHDRREVLPSSRDVTFRVTDDSWSNVYLDGRKVYEPRAMADEKTISVSVGEHTIEVKDFMDNDVWCRGTLIVDGHTDLIIGLAEEKSIEVFNDRGAFIGR